MDGAGRSTVRSGGSRTVPSEGRAMMPRLLLPGDDAIDGASAFGDVRRPLSGGRRRRGEAPAQGTHPSPPNAGQTAHDGIVASWALIVAIFWSCFAMYRFRLAVSQSCGAGLGRPFRVRRAR